MTNHFDKSKFRYFLAYVLGIATWLLVFKALTALFRLIRVYDTLDLAYPVAQSVGRYDIDLTDVEWTWFGHAVLALSIVVGANIGTAVYRRTWKPWRTKGEIATSRAWWFIAVVLTLYFAVLQLLVRTLGNSVLGQILSVAEIALPAYMCWKVWQWWKVASDETKHDGG